MADRSTPDAAEAEESGINLSRRDVKESDEKRPVSKQQHLVVLR
jgi:hypothetical protein